MDSKGENEPRDREQRRVDAASTKAEAPNGAGAPMGAGAPLGAGLARGVGAYLMIPTMMGVGPVLGYLLGSWLERRYGYAPWLSFAGVVLGAVASVRQIIRILQTYKSTGTNERRRDDGP